MKTRTSTWLFVWDLLAENEFADLYRCNAVGNDDGGREGTLCNKVIKCHPIQHLYKKPHDG